MQTINQPVEAGITAPGKQPEVFSGETAVSTAVEESLESSSSYDLPSMNEEPRFKQGQPRPPKPEEARMIEGIAKYQDSLNMLDEEFAKHLRVTASTWSKVKRGVYGADYGRVLSGIRSAVVELRASKEREWDQQREREAFHSFSHVSEFFSHLDEARANARAGEERRIVWFLAPSGGGKDAIRREIVKLHPAIIVTARESCHSSYYAMLLVIARACGITHTSRGGVAALEALIIDFLNLNHYVVVFNECERTSESFLNLLKTLTNETKATVVLLALPDLFKSLSRYRLHATQILQRSFVTRFTHLKPEHVRKFLEESWPDTTELRKCAKRLADAANQFGLFRLVRQVSRWVREECGRGETAIQPTEELIGKKIEEFDKARREALA